MDHNLFDGVGGNGVWLHAYNRKAMVSGNEMRNIGTQTRTLRSELCPCFLTESVCFLMAQARTASASPARPSGSTAR